MSPVQIFAVGGGGFTDQQDGWPGDGVLEDRLLAVLGPADTVRIGYIGHASEDDEGRISAFYRRFSQCAATSHLPLKADCATAAAFLSEVDMLYVGGGSTTRMLGHWRATGIAKQLAAAAHRGVVMAGVSAGAICWFDDLLLGTAEEGYALCPGLGLLVGSACPHYHNEMPRKEAYDSHILAGTLTSGLAIDDGVAVLITDGVVTAIERARGAGEDAYFVGAEAGGLQMQPLQLGQSFMLGQNLLG